jgi:death on curing protein
MTPQPAEPTWLTRVVVDAIHTDQVREHGGLLGLRDENALESAIARPRHKWLHERPVDLASLGAACAFGLAKNHPYHDGNTRVALLAMLTFLATNGHDVEAADDDVLATMLGLASGHLGESELAAWLRPRMLPIK